MSNCLIERLNGSVYNENPFPEFNRYAGIITSYIIDQDHVSENPITYKVSSDMIVKDIPSKDATETVIINDKEVKLDVVARIRDLSYLCAGECRGNNTPLYINKISRTNKREFPSGSTVDYQQGGGIFMKLPQFWWRCERVSLNGPKYRIDFTLDENIVDEYIISDAPWHEWDGNTFIGVYQSVLDGNLLASIENYTSENDLTYEDAKAYAHNNSPGFSLITYETFKVMYLLALAWYKTPKFMEYLGEGHGSSEPIAKTGICDSLGMTDTVAGENLFTWKENGETKSAHATNFWGLENFFGGPYSEWIEDLVTGPNGTVRILNEDNEVVRTMNVGEFIGLDGSITKLLLGENADIMPAEWTAEEDKGFGYGNTADTSGKRFRTIEGSSYPNLLCTEAANVTGNTFGARIQWNGPWQEYL